MTVLQKLRELLQTEHVFEDKPLALYTTLKVGGSAQYYFEATTSADIARAVKAAVSLDIPYFVFGGGSNIVVGDGGIPGLTIHNRARKIAITAMKGKISHGESIGSVMVTAESGALMNQLVRFTADEGLSGLEYHLGLPGTVGGALYMNSKWTHPVTYVGDVLYEAEVVSRDGTVKTVRQSYFDFGYDQSILQQTKETVLTATFQLTRLDPKIVWERAQGALAYRTETQPKGVNTAGCTFRNIPKSEAMRIPTPNHITSAGYLVDTVGLKNFQIGNAAFSDKHANFIINKGEATAQDVKALIDTAKSKVHARYGIEIEPEIVLVGKFS